MRLFGSFARGEADGESDIDVLVLVDALTDREIGEVAGDVAPVLLATGLPPAPLPMATERLQALRADEPPPPVGLPGARPRRGARAGSSR